MPNAEMRLVYSVRSAEDLIYADELGDDAVSHSPASPDGWNGHTGASTTLIAEAEPDTGVAFVCGTNGFVETASRLMMQRESTPADSHGALRPTGKPGALRPKKRCGSVSSRAPHVAPSAGATLAR